MAAPPSRSPDGTSTRPASGSHRCDSPIYGRSSYARSPGACHSCWYMVPDPLPLDKASRWFSGSGNGFRSRRFNEKDRGSGMPRLPMKQVDLDERLVARFWKNVRVTDGCWEWLLSLNDHGYGQIRINRQPFRAHRLSWQIHHGPVPEGMCLDHLCRNRACVNPAHLEPVSVRENNLRGVGACASNAKKTSCRFGHLYTPENTYRRPGFNFRECITCMRGRESDRPKRCYKQCCRGRKRSDAHVEEH